MKDNLYDVERCPLVEAIRQRFFDLEPGYKFQHYIYLSEIEQHVPPSRGIELEFEKLKRKELEIYGFLSINWDSRMKIKIQESKRRRFGQYCKLMNWELREVDRDRIELLIKHPFDT